MSDISLPWGGQIQPDETGDILCVSGNQAIAQRIVRRVLSNPYVNDAANGVVSDPDYYFAPFYGGGVRAYVDAPNNAVTRAAVTNRIKSQLNLEADIDRSAPPTITVTFSQGSVLINGNIPLSNGQVLPLPQMEVLQ